MSQYETNKLLGVGIVHRLRQQSRKQPGSNAEICTLTKLYPAQVAQV